MINMYVCSRCNTHADVLECSVKSSLGFLLLFFFFFSLKVLKSLRLNPSVVIYLQSRDISATILSSLSEKGVCCGFTLAFDLKATKLTWMLKYLTCSPSIRNSCFSAGGLPGGTHPKNKGTGQRWDSS